MTDNTNNRDKAIDIMRPWINEYGVTEQGLGLAWDALIAANLLVVSPAPPDPKNEPSDDDVANALAASTDYFVPYGHRMQMVKAVQSLFRAGRVSLSASPDPENEPSDAQCICDGANFAPNQKHPFLIHTDCPVHSPYRAGRVSLSAPPETGSHG